MSHQTSSKPSPPFWLLIGARKLVFFWHQSEAKTAATVWNWSGKTLSPGALLAVLYFSFVPYFPACLDFPSPPLSAPGSPRMPLVSPPNDIWKTSTEIPYWWCVTTQIWVVLLIGWIKFPTWHHQSEALPHLFSHFHVPTPSYWGSSN